VVVGQTLGLHERICRGRSDEPPSPALEFLRQCGRTRRHRGNATVAVASGFDDRPAPDPVDERALGLDQFDGAPGVVDRRLDLAAVTNDPRVAKESLDVALAETSHLFDVEPGERGTEVRALAQDREPAEPGLETLEADLLEQAGRIGRRSTPLVVVVRKVQRVIARPRATDRIGVLGHGVHEPRLRRSRIC
jgi:hypothetical protein